MFYDNFWSFWDNPILYFGAACILTVLIETVFFRLFGFKSRLDLRIIALTNVFTNEALNLFLHFEPGAFDTFWIIILELLDDTYGTALRIFDTRIPFSVRAAEATAEGVSIFKHDPKGKVACAYHCFTKEVTGL